MADAPSFTKLVPGFDFLQGLVKNAGAALPSIGQWVAPTLNPDELEKRISELKTLQFWLEQNARMIGMTVQALEVQQQKLLAQAKSRKSVQAETRRSEEQQPEQASVRGADLAQSALAIARMEAQIERQIDEYNKRPRKKFIGARTEEYAAAQDLEDWRLKVERIGNLNYPEAAKGRLYGNLLLYVEIKADGSLERVEVQRSSGHKILDEAAMRIVRMAAPYGSFSAELKRQTDIVAFARTWVFARGDQLRSE